MLVEGGDEHQLRVDRRLGSSRRATSKPVRPGIWTSRNTRSGFSASITCSASRPLPAWPTTSTPPICPSRKHSSSRASCSSSTTTRAECCRSLPCQALHPRRDDQLGNLDAGAGAFAGHAVELQLVVGAVDDAQPLVDVAQADAAGLHAARRCVGLMPTPLSMTSMIAWPFSRTLRMRDAPFADLRRQAVLDRVLDQRLQQHARHDDVEACPGRSPSRSRSCGPKRTLSMSRYSSIDSSSSRSVTKCSWLRSSRRSRPESLTISIRAVSGCERISEEIDVSVLNRKCGLIWLASASIARRQQQLLLFLQPVLDAGAVPDLDRRSRRTSTVARMTSASSHERASARR